MENSLENDIDNEASSSSYNHQDNSLKSKKNKEDRKFVCDCGKAYLSQPALTNHKKTKHEDGAVMTNKRGRGRPRKNVEYI